MKNKRKLMKTLLKTGGTIGFMIAFGTAGISDFEIETGVHLLTQAQFYFRILLSLFLLLSCSIGLAMCDKVKPSNKVIHKPSRPNMSNLRKAA